MGVVLPGGKRAREAQIQHACRVRQIEHHLGNKTGRSVRRHVSFGRSCAVRPSLPDRRLHTKYRTFFAIGSHVLGRCRLKPDRRLTVAKTATLSQRKHLLGSGRIGYRSISPSSRSSSRPVNPMIMLSLAPFERRGENSDDETAAGFSSKRVLRVEPNEPNSCAATPKVVNNCNPSNHVRILRIERPARASTSMTAPWRASLEEPPRPCRAR